VRRYEMFSLTLQQSRGIGTDFRFPSSSNLSDERRGRSHFQPGSTHDDDDLYN
jgi:transitional endoplasmic reticulum ATPase